LICDKPARGRSVKSNQRDDDECADQHPKDPQTTEDTAFP
jgi:hypothetical protein